MNAIQRLNQQLEELSGIWLGDCLAQDVINEGIEIANTALNTIGDVARAESEINFLQQVVAENQ